MSASRASPPQSQASAASGADAVPADAPPQRPASAAAIEDGPTEFAASSAAARAAARKRASEEAAAAKLAREVAEVVADEAALTAGMTSSDVGGRALRRRDALRPPRDPYLTANAAHVASVLASAPGGLIGDLAKGIARTRRASAGADFNAAGDAAAAAGVEQPERPDWDAIPELQPHRIVAEHRGIALASPEIADMEWPPGARPGGAAGVRRKDALVAARDALMIQSLLVSEREALADARPEPLRVPPSHWREWGAATARVAATLAALHALPAVEAAEAAAADAAAKAAEAAIAALAAASPAPEGEEDEEGDESEEKTDDEDSDSESSDGEWTPKKNGMPRGIVLEEEEGEGDGEGSDDEGPHIAVSSSEEEGEEDEEEEDGQAAVGMDADEDAAICSSVGTDGAAGGGGTTVGDADAEKRATAQG